MGTKFDKNWGKIDIKNIDKYVKVEKRKKKLGKKGKEEKRKKEEKSEKKWEKIYITIMKNMSKR